MDWQRRGDPNIPLNQSLKQNPAAEERQREDLRLLCTQNRNPRLDQLTAADQRRSESFTYEYGAEASSGIDAKLFNVKAGSISRFGGENLEDVKERMSQISFSPKHKSGTQHGNFETARVTGGGSPSRREMSDVEIEDAEVMHNYDIALKLAPPSFGHRPSSAARVFNPVTMGIRKSKNMKLKSSSQIIKRKKKKQGANVTGIMSTSMLKHLLTGGADEGGSVGGGFDQQQQRFHQQSYQQPQTNTFDDLSIDTNVEPNNFSVLNTTIDSNLQHSFTTLSPKHQISPTNHSSYFDKTYVVPPKEDKPKWTDSFAAAHYDVRETRPLLVLNREDREAKTLDRIERFRFLAAGKTKSAVTNADRDATMLAKSEWKEEVDRRFHKIDHTGVKMSPRTKAVNRDVKGILKERERREMRLKEKIKNWERVVEEERTEKIIARRRGKGKLIYDGV
mmetsp:Transcript_75/g.147  ORF Transcript_75/g.147 Transcript_75/m.147 type:complete len:449 (-) Transcript_75:69-1415(-)